MLFLAAHIHAGQLYIRYNYQLVRLHTLTLGNIHITYLCSYWVSNPQTQISSTNHTNPTNLNHEAKYWKLVNIPKLAIPPTCQAVSKVIKHPLYVYTVIPPAIKSACQHGYIVSTSDVINNDTNNTSACQHEYQWRHRQASTTGVRCSQGVIELFMSLLLCLTNNSESTSDNFTTQTVHSILVNMSLTSLDP
jgi:hypothetical protein